MRAKKALGQNFLRDETVIAKIVAALNLTEADTVIEIGPGRGALTKDLIETGARIIAIEFDRDLIEPLHHRFDAYKNFAVLNADALNVDFASILSGVEGQAKLAANLPYNISTPILQRLIEHRHLFSTLVLMFQREVVARITAPPGDSDRGFLSVLVEDAFDSERVFDIPPSAFWPVPKVWSSVVRLTPKSSNTVDQQGFRSLISRSFAQKRKTILNNLKIFHPNAAAFLDRAEIDPRRRAETLTLDEWKTLAGEVLSH